LSDGSKKAPLDVGVARLQPERRSATTSPAISLNEKRLRGALDRQRDAGAGASPLLETPRSV